MPMPDRPRLYLNHIAPEYVPGYGDWFDWLIALEFGRVDDMQPSENWRGVDDHFGFLHDHPGGPEVGFKVKHFSEFDANAPDVEEIWSGAGFDAPALGLTNVSAGEIVIAARTLFAGESSINRAFFDAANAAEDPREALAHWLACLQAGDSMAHYGLGYTLYELGRYHEAYRHLRHYTEISPCGGWNWCWLGKAAEAIGEFVEARQAYERALELEPEHDEETDARELLAALDARVGGGGAGGGGA